MVFNIDCFPDNNTGQFINNQMHQKQNKTFLQLYWDIYVLLHQLSPIYKTNLRLTFGVLGFVSIFTIALLSHCQGSANQNHRKPQKSLQTRRNNSLRINFK